MKKIKHIFLALLFALVSLLSSPTTQAATTISITSPTANATTGSAFTVSGTATANRTVTVKINGSSVGSTTSDSSGNWSLGVTGQSAGAKTIEATASTQLMYTNILNASDFSASRMSRINTLTNTQESSFSIYGASAFPITWKPNPAFTKAYGVAPYLNSATVWVMDLLNGTVSTFTLPGITPRGAAVAYNTDGSKVYITDNANTLVRVYDTSTDIQIGSPITVGAAPHSNTKRPGNNEVWIANSAANTASVINTVSDTVTNTYAVVGGPNGITFSPDGSTVYIGTTNGVHVINASTGVTTNTITGSAAPEVLLINSAGTKLYASNPQGNTIDVFNLSSAALESTVTVGSGPWGMALTANESRLYVANPNLNGSLSGTTISIIDTANNTVVNTITPGGGAPFFIFAAPPESGSDTINITVSSGTLADTGDNVNFLTAISLALVASGVISGAFWRTNRRKQTTLV